MQLNAGSHSTARFGIAHAPWKCYRISRIGVLHGCNRTTGWTDPIGVGHFFPGELMTSEQLGAPLTYVYLGFTYRFKVEH